MQSNIVFDGIWADRYTIQDQKYQIDGSKVNPTDP